MFATDSIIAFSMTISSGNTILRGLLLPDALITQVIDVAGNLHNTVLQICSAIFRRLVVWLGFHGAFNAI